MCYAEGLTLAEMEVEMMYMASSIVALLPQNEISKMSLEQVRGHTIRTFPSDSGQFSPEYFDPNFNYSQ